MLVASLTLIRFVVASLKGWLNIYLSEIFDKYLRIYLIFFMKTVGASLYEKCCFMAFLELFRIADIRRLVMQTHSENRRIQEIVQIFIKVWEKISQNYH